MSAPVLHDPRIEAAVVGATIVSSAAARAVVDRGVIPEHFANARLRTIMSVVAVLVDENAATDPVTVAARLRALGVAGDASLEADLDALTADASSVGALPGHVAELVELAGWRTRHTAAADAAAACVNRDRDALTIAESRLWESGAGERRRSDWTPQQAGDDFMAVLDAATQDVFPWPYQRLNFKSDGGAARGEITVLAGPITHGKSALLDQCLESMHAPGLHARLYLNEMRRHQRMARVCARRSGVDLSALQRSMRGLGSLAPADRELARRSWEHYPVHITECSGWPIERIVRHARRSSADIVALDILNRLPAPPSGVSRVAQLDDAINQLDRLAKECDMHVIVVAHLNRVRSRETGKPPMPSLTDIKDCAAVPEVADNVLFVWRDTDKAGDPGDTGTIRFGKNRTGELGGLGVRFDGPHQRFLEIDRALESVA